MREGKIIIKIYKKGLSWGVLAQTFNLSTQESEARPGDIMISRPAWSTEGVPGQPGLQREFQASLGYTESKILNKNKQIKTRRFYACGGLNKDGPHGLI